MAPIRSCSLTRKETFTRELGGTWLRQTSEPDIDFYGWLILSGIERLDLQTRGPRTFWATCSAFEESRST